MVEPPEQPPIPFDDIPEQPTVPAATMAARFALVHVLSPEANGFTAADYADISERQLEYARPERMRPSLLDIPNPIGKIDVVALPYDYTKRRTGVAVTSEEYKLLGLSIKNAGNRSFSRTRDARKTEENVDEKNAAALRSLGYTINGMIAKRRTYIQNVLEPKVALIDRFDEAARYPSLSRGSEAGLRIARTTLWTDVFKEMFDVMQVQQGWNKDQTLWAARLADARIFAVKPLSRQAANLQGMLALAKEWIGVKRDVIEDQIAQGVERLDEVGIDIDDTSSAAV